MLDECTQDEGCSGRWRVWVQEGLNCGQVLQLWSTRLGDDVIKYPNLIISPSGTSFKMTCTWLPCWLHVFEENHLATLSKRHKRTTRGFIGDRRPVGQHAPDVLNPSRMQLCVISECLKVCALLGKRPSSALLLGHESQAFITACSLCSEG